ncbi:MAG: hypothetical protein KatS3mg014_0618 [Actinomycetota bacterium]|nr:MAG: hypothetical protein KatS3mg014_0618 [Actinomycetota bacterium]
MRRMRMRLPASSMRSMALSGRNRSLMYRSARLAAATRASSVMVTRWWASYRSRSPLRISMVWATVGSSTTIGWNRRSRAASFSRCLRYSSSVVAPMVCSSPRASIGLRMLAASIAPSAAPAPTRVWISSMNRMMSPGCGSPSAPSSGAPRSRRGSGSPPPARPGRACRAACPCSVSGTSPGTIVLGETLDDGGLADTGLADEHGVVLRPAGQDLHDPLDLPLAPDDRVELALPGELGEVPPELVEHQRARPCGTGGAPRWPARPCRRCSRTAAG